MRRFLIQIMLAVIVVCLIGCNKGHINDISTSDTRENYVNEIYSEKYQSVSISEIGPIWTNSEPFEFIKYTSVNSNDRMFLCFDPNCSHPETTKENPDPVCMAALYRHRCETAYYNGAVYIFVAENIGENVLYKMDLNGSSREVVATFPFEAKPDRGCIFYNNKAYVSVSILQTNLDEIEGMQKLEYASSFVEIDLINKTYRYLGEEFGNHIYVSDIDVMGDSLFVRVADQLDDGRLYMMRYNIRTSEAEVFISKDEWASGYRYIRHFDEDSYLYWDRNLNEIGIKSLNGTVEKKLLKGPEGERFLAQPSCDGMMYSRTMDYEGDTAGYYFMDFETWEVTDITEEVEKYSLVTYDGYYDVFVGREYIEKYDPDTFTWSTWSKDRILSEAKE